MVCGGKLASLMIEYNVGISTARIFEIKRLDSDYFLNKTEKHSRHLYDIYKLFPLVPQDDTFKKLVKEVREVRALSPVCPSAKPDVNIVELLNNIISENVYKSDYVDITKNLLEERLNYETVIPALKQIAKNGMFDN